MKLIAFRAQDEMDIQDLLAAYGSTIDMNYLRAELDAIMETNDPRRVKLESWVRRATEV